MKNLKVVWTPQAKCDLREIKKFISRDAPRTANAFVRRLKSRVDQLKSFPDSGSVVPEIGNPAIREVLQGSYRVIYRRTATHIEVLTVYHSARLLNEGDV